MLEAALFHDGHDHDHDDFQHDHDGAASLESAAWALDNVELTTVGVDVGSSTSHLLFARLHLQRPSRSLSSRFEVVERQVLHRSPILLTPYRADGLIDVAALERFVTRAYADAGLKPDDVDTGAVILTGAALERANARNVAELFASEGGKFVCASAGHNLEAILAAHGSGAAVLSRQCGGPLLHVDIGGGTTKLAIVHNGEVLHTAAIHVGGRLVAFDAQGRVTRIEPSGALVAEELGIPLQLGQRLDEADRSRIAYGLAGILLDYVWADDLSALDESFLLTEPLPRVRPTGLTFSGGVAEYVYGRTSENYGDLGPQLAEHFFTEQLPAPIMALDEGIRATVLGASQFSVQLSGNTVRISDPGVLPLRNLPVVHAQLEGANPSAQHVASAVARGFRRLDLAEGDQPVAIMLPWAGEPHYVHLRALAEGIAAAVPRSLQAGLPMVIALDGDIASSLGGILVEDLGVGVPLVAIDGLQLVELDYVDIGELLQPANVVPVVVKSLAFGGSLRTHDRVAVVR
jgi:ethanolamine utilization protein EutA